MFDHADLLHFGFYNFFFIIINYDSILYNLCSSSKAKKRFQ